MKLLLADDDSFLLDMYSVKFTEAGDDVIAVKDGDQALSILRKGETFDGVLLDIIMPGISGLDLLVVAKKEKLGGADCKYIVLSNQGEQSDLAAAHEAGAAGYIVKAEAMPSEVVEKVTRIIKG
ncbi:response regulator [Candidatus Kaiserbacteria bacterium]|nr:response regulator [Candidatus Kaiserbacteria bacterium]